MKKDDYDFTRMYMDYCQELEQYFANGEKMTRREQCLRADEYIHDRYSRIILARPNIAFLIVTRKGGDCHPMADYTIAQLYVKPDFRRHGIAGDLVRNFVNSHGGTYAYDIINNNKPEEAFWKKLISENGWEDAELPEVRPEEVRPYWELHSFRAKAKERT